MSTWHAPTATGPVTATVTLPGSKSITNRALVLAALADGPSTLRGVLRSRDTDLMLAAVETLGVGVHADAGDPTTVVVTPRALHGGTVDCGLAGTVMRFVPPVAALADGAVTVDGDEQMRARPVDTILRALADLGVAVDGRSLPFTITGTGAVRAARSPSTHRRRRSSCPDSCSAQPASTTASPSTTWANPFRRNRTST